MRKQSSFLVLSQLSCINVSFTDILTTHIACSLFTHLKWSTRDLTSKWYIVTICPMWAKSERMRKQDFIRRLSPDRSGQSHGLRHNMWDEKIHALWIIIVLGGAKSLSETGTSCGHRTVKRLACDGFYLFHHRKCDTSQYSWRML